jgi:WD40 repeat protein
MKNDLLTPNLEQLPDELLLHIFSFFNTKQLGRMGEVNQNCYRLSRDSYLDLPPSFNYSEPNLVTALGVNLIHNPHVRSATIISDDEFIFANDKSLLIWNNKLRAVTNILHGHNDKIYCVLRLSNGQIASGSRDGTIRLWDLEQGICFKLIRLHFSSVHCIIELSNGDLASASTDSTIRIFNKADWHCKRVLSACTYTPYFNKFKCLTELSNGYLASGGRATSITIWDPGNGKIIHTFTGHTKKINALLALSNNRLLSASDDCSLRLWNYQSKKAIANFQGHRDKIKALSQLPSGHIISVSEDGGLCIWDVENLTCMANITSEAYTGIEFLKPLGNGRILATGTNEPRLICFNKVTPEQIATASHTKPDTYCRIC